MFHVEARTFGRQKQEEWMKSCSMKVNFRIYFQLLCFKFKVLTTLRESVSHSVVSDSFATPLLRVHQAPLSMEFSRQEYWSGLPFCSPGDLPDPGIKPGVSCIRAETKKEKKIKNKIRDGNESTLKHWEMIFLFTGLTNLT